MVTLVETQEKHLPELSAIEDVVSGDYYEKKASDVLNKLLKKTKKEAASKSLEEIKNQYGKTYNTGIETTAVIKKNNQEQVNALRSKGYPAEKILALEKISATDYYRAGPSETADGYLVKLVELEKFDDKEFSEKKNDIKQELARLKSMAQLEEFIAFLRKKAKLKTNR